VATNLIMTRGDTYTFTLAVTQAGVAFNLTGCTLRMTAKYNVTDLDSAAVFSLTSPSTGIAITNAAAGLATVSIPPSGTSTLPGAQIPLFYDIQVTDSSSDVYTVASGTLYVQPDISITTP
jgi:hypothetical protein